MVTAGSTPEIRERLILGEQLRKARLMLGVVPKEAAGRLGVSEGDILAWEEERTVPSLSQLEGLADLYGRSVDYFLRDTPPAPDRIEFRSASKAQFRSLSQEARRVLAKFDDLCRAALEIEQMLGKYRQPPQCRPTNLPPSELARECRETFGFGEKPVTQLRDRLAGTGVRVFELPVPSGAFSGFSYWHRDYGPCILMNSSESPGRKNFTLAHEYDHLLYGHAASVCDIREGHVLSVHADERAASRFAVEFLLPTGPVRQDFAHRELSSTPTLAEIGRMSGRWRVSVQAMGYRLEELGLVVRGQTDQLLQSYRPPHPRRPKVPRFERQRGKDFVANALEAYREGKISLGKAAQCLGISLREALELAEMGK